MGHAASAANNPSIGSFWSLLQTNAFNQRPRWATRQDLRLAIVTWGERRFHREREQKALSGLTSIEHEATMEPPMALVA
ncbi:MAG: hypothetical protein ACOH1T_06885 [Microbacteriaceae bacterium]